MKLTATAKQNRVIDDLVQHFINNQNKFEILLNQLDAHVMGSNSLKPLIHSVKYRTKDPEHLRDKLNRKMLLANKDGLPFDITTENLFLKINDLAGYRILHLHTQQIEQINTELKNIFNEQQWILLEGPGARTWDDEYRGYFNSIGIDVVTSPSMYTSVHYVVKPNFRSEITGEIQVRTLMEEVWGEVDHSINYPHKTEVMSCQEQIKVLARVTSSCSRLVDSIFTAHRQGPPTINIASKKKAKKATKIKQK